MIILGLDALDLNMVQKYDCRNLMQQEHGKTDLSEFEKERTVVLWASFLTGKNLESKIPLKTQWEFKLRKNETFFSFFKTYATVDVPAFSLKEENHSKERRLLKGYFEDKSTIEDYDKIVWKNHKGNKRDFLRSLGKHDLVMGYFDLADAIGHLSFGISEKMEKVYLELEDLAKKIKEISDETVLIISDHGMKSLGRYGDHNRNGYYSLNIKLRLNLPKITDFYSIIKEGALR